MVISKRVKKVFIRVGMLAIVLPLGLRLADNIMPPLIRQALPVDAAHVRQFYNPSYNLNGDFVRGLQVDIPQSEMSGFAAKLGLTQRYSSRKDAKFPVNFGAEDAPAWWQPPTTLDGAYFKYTPGRDAFSVAQYENGHVYFLASAW